MIGEVEGAGSGQLLRVGPVDDPDRYVLEERVGQPGGEGQVWRAYPSEDLDRMGSLPPRYLAIKQLLALQRPPESRAGLGKRWMNSAEFMQTLHAPGLARVVGGFEGAEPHFPGESSPRTTWYLVMEWVQGLTYEQYLVHHHGDITPLGEAAVGLDHLHAAGYVHGDVKPDNLKIVQSDYGAPISKLVDLGLIREITGERSSLVVRSEAYTDPGLAVGHPYSELSDLYSFAATLYRGLVGTQPNIKNYPAAVRKLAAFSQGRGVDRIAAALDPDPDRRSAKAGYRVKFLREWFVEVVEDVKSIPAQQRADAIRTATMGGTTFTMETADSVELSQQIADEVITPLYRFVLDTRRYLLLVVITAVVGLALGAILA